MDSPVADILSREAWVPRRKIQVDEYHLMGDIGLLRRDERIELVEGEIIQMAPIGSEHSGSVIRGTRELIRLLGDRAVLSVQGPVRLDLYNEPEPDFALLRPRADDYLARLPGPADVLLLIEVADSSLRYDRTVKVPLYARHGIPEVWIVNVPERMVAYHRGPGEGGYAESGRAGREETLTAALLPDVAIPLRILMPG